jgi:hypothetical protein
MTRGGSITWYAPNQQAVRADGSGPAEEGDGGTPHATHPDRPPPDPATTTTSIEASEQDLDAMTKEELLAYAEQLGVDVDVSMTKAQIREAIGA